MKKLNHKDIIKISKIDNRIAQLDIDINNADTRLRQAHSMSHSHYIRWTKMDWDRNIHELDELEQYTDKQTSLNARKIVLSMIGYNIAHRGKKLHPTTAIKKLEKLGTTGAILKYDFEHFDPDIISAEFKQYGITLLDENHCSKINKQLGHLVTHYMDMPVIMPTIENRIKRLCGKMNMFHKTMIEKVKEKQL